MQNTTHHKEQPDKLLENFFISGISQPQLMLKFNKITGASRVNPEILFSMYQSPNSCNSLVQQVFPNKISLSSKIDQPTFHTFLVRNMDGDQTFCHCFIFQEELDAYQLSEDFDYEGPLMMLKKQRMMEQMEQIQSQTKRSSSGSRETVSNSKKVTNSKQLDDKSDCDIYSVCDIAKNHDRIQRQFTNAPKKRTGGFQLKRLQDKKKKIEQSLKSKTAQEHEKHYQLHLTRATANNAQEMKADLDRMTKLKDEYEDLINYDQSIFNDMIDVQDLEASNYNKTQVFAYEQKQINQRKISVKNRHLSALYNLSPVDQQDSLRQSNFSNVQSVSKFSQIMNMDRRCQNQHVQQMIQQNIMQDSALTQNVDHQPLATDSSVMPLQRLQKNSIYKQTPRFQRGGGILNTQQSADVDESIIDNNSFVQSNNAPYGGQNQDACLDLDGKFLQSHVDNNSSQGSTKQEQSNQARAEQIAHIKSQLNNKWYVPVAFCIMTKVEFHDAFKLILQIIYEKLRSPAKYSQMVDQKFKESKYFDKVNLPDIKNLMGFSETIAHLSFLRTIPAPVFNSEVTIQFMGTIVNLKENSFGELPHKNQNSIKILLECLDFKTILTCLRGLIFDYTLIVFCHETSLLFNIVEGLKQLMFPFTFDLTQYLPANQNYEVNGQTQKDIFEDFAGMQPCIFAIETFSDKQEYNRYMECRGAVILDIDASYVQVNSHEEQEEDDLPQFPNYIEFLQLLNMLKNRMFGNYDKVYPERNIPPEVDQENFQIQQIRECVFEKLLPFIKPAFQVIKTDIEKPRQMKEYWSQEEYLKKIEDQNDIDSDKTLEYIRFAKRLCISQSFADFIDGYLEEKLMNFDLVNSILCHRGELKQRYKLKSSTFSQFDKVVKQRIEGLNSNQQKELTVKIKQLEETQYNDPRFFFQDEVVTFNYKIPSYQQRKMLFEKIRYLVDAHFNEKDNIFKSSIPRKQKSSEKNEHLENLNQHKKIKPYYKKIIALVRQVYDDSIEESKKQPQSVNQSQIQDHDNVSELEDKVESLRNNRNLLGENQNGSLARTETPRFQAQRFGSQKISEQDIKWAYNILQKALENQKQQIDSQTQRKTSAFGTKSIQLRNQQTSFGFKKDAQANQGQVENQDKDENQAADQKTPLQDSTIRRLREPEQSQNLNENLEQSQLIENNQLLLSQLTQYLMNKGDRQSLNPNNFNQSLRGTDSNVTCNFGAKQEQDRFSSVLGLPQQFNTIMLSSLGNDKDQKEIKHAIDVLQQSIQNDRRVTMNQVQGPEQQNIIALDPDKQGYDSNSESQISQSTVKQRDKIYQVGQKSIQGSVRSRDVSPNSIPKSKVEEYKEQSDSQIEVGESQFNHLSHLSKKGQPQNGQQQLALNLKKMEQARIIELSSSELIQSELVEQTPGFPIDKQQYDQTPNTHDASNSIQLDTFKKPSIIQNGNLQVKHLKNIQIQSLEINRNQVSKMVKAEVQETQTMISDDQTNFTGYGQVLGDREQAKLLANKNRKGSVDSKKLGSEKGSLIYGKRGMLNFMENLFVYLTEYDKSKLNFYFTIRDSIIEFIDLRQQYNEQLIKSIQNESQNIDESSLEFKNDMYEAFMQSPLPEGEIIQTKKDQNLQRSRTSNIQKQRKLSNKMERKPSVMSDKNKYNIKSISNNSITPQTIIPCPNGQICQPNRMKSIIMRDFYQSNRTDAASPGGQIVQKIYTTSMLFKSQMTQIQKHQQSSRKSSWSYTQVQGNSPVKNQIESSNQFVMQSVENISNIQLSQKEILEQQYAQVQDTCWFWTENDASQSESGDSGTDYHQRSIFQSITYQEILFFIKLVRTFEDHKNVGSMLLQLIINFPLVWRTLPKENTGAQSSGPSGFELKDVLQYMFPLDRLTATLDNMCRQQIIDLYQILNCSKLQRASQKSAASKHSIMAQSKFIPQVCQSEYQLKMPCDYSSNELLTQNSQQSPAHTLEAPIYKDLIKLLIYEEYRGKMEEMKDEEKVLNTETSELFKQYQMKRSKRDFNSSDHYEIVDERIFLECSVYRILIVDQIKAEKQKSIELFQKQQDLQEEEEKQLEESRRLSFGNMTCKDPYVEKMLQDEEKEKKLKKKMSKVKKKASKGSNNMARSSSQDSDYYDKQADNRVQDKRPSLLQEFTFFFKSKASVNSKASGNDSKKSKKKKGVQTARNSIDNNPFQMETSEQIPQQRFNLSNELEQKDFQQIQETRDRQKQQKRQSDVISEEFFRQQLESYISNSRPQNNDRVFKKVKNPISVSIQLLEKIVSFWTKDFNQTWLHKFKSGTQDERQQRLHYLHKVLKKIQAFEFFEPVFDQTDLVDSIQRPMPQEQFQEYSKQCFYLNIYNALILFKIAEIGTIKGDHLSKFVNHNSWVALEQNVSIKFHQKEFTAYQIKHEVIKNARCQPPSPYCVNRAEIHPLIDFAFFCPRGGSLQMESLCFWNVTCLDFNLQTYVNKYLQSKIVVSPDYSLIFLPECLRVCLQMNDQKNPNINTYPQLDQSYQSKQRLRVIGQQQKVLNNLMFIRENILPNDQVLDGIISKIRLQVTSLLVDGKLDYKDAKEYVIEYQAHSQAFKKEKIINGKSLKEYHKDILTKEAKKCIQYEETVVVEERSSESGSQHQI